MKYVRRRGRAGFAAAFVLMFLIQSAGTALAQSCTILSGAPFCAGQRAHTTVGNTVVFPVGPPGHRVGNFIVLEVDVDHLYGLEFFQDRSGGEARRQGAQALLEGDLQAIGDEGHKDMGLDAMVELVIDRPDREVAVQLLEGLLDLGEPPRKGGSNPL